MTARSLPPSELSGSGILLDLHNLWCNERNGRQRVRDAINQLPLDRVWELHFGGGMLLNGVWLDAHSGPIPPEVIDLAGDLMPWLPNVGALVFEVLPEHLGRLGLDGVLRQLELLRELWATRPIARSSISTAQSDEVIASLHDREDARAWERRLSYVLNDELPGDALAAQPGCAVLKVLIHDARSASIARGLRYTTTALLAGLGPEAAARLLSHYFAVVPPNSFVAVECHEFVRFMRQHEDLTSSVPYLDEILAFEAGLLEASFLGRSSVVHWTVDPTELLSALDSGSLPKSLPCSASEMTITA